MECENLSFGMFGIVLVLVGIMLQLLNIASALRALTTKGE